MFSSVRLRLTLWYALAFGLLLTCFSIYVLSSLSHDLRSAFDQTLMRTADATASYFDEFVERNNPAAGAAETIREFSHGKTRVAIFRGHEVIASNGANVVSLALRSNLVGSVRLGEYGMATDSERNERLAAVPIRINSVTYTVAVLESMRELSDELARMRQIVLFAMPAAFLLAALGGFFLAGKSLEPVVTISAQAERITAKNLDERLDVKSRDEFARLAAVFNALLSRLDKSFRVMREFMADASHELRTPLAIIHGEAEVSLSRERTVDEYRESISTIRDNSKRMARIVKDMLDLARADSGQQMLRREELYLDDVVTACCRSAQPLAQLKQIRLSCSADQDLSFQGDEELLRRMLVNLLHNAIQYTPSGGAVSVMLKRENHDGVLTISDTGIGIPQASLDRIFDRFYRVAEARTRADGGSGLGLSIVKLAAECHGGAVSVASRPGKGSTFTVRLPLDSQMMTS
ncbi:MAG: heavy metal sensor histidine kinase [Acidobacteriaceae bacterium]|nr:heavy metal sensor histidine kinase [Acidobacteriaceae bacterium]